MASVRDIPFDAARQVVDGVRASSVARRSCVRIAIEVEKGAPTALVRAVKEAFVPQTATGLVHVAAFAAGTQVRVNPDCDLAIVLAGTTGAATAAARAFAGAAVPCAIVVETSVEVPVREQPAGVEVVAAADDAVLLDKLAAWMAGTCHADVALGTNFPFARRAIAERCASERSTKNAVIGLLPFGSSADLPVMAANEALMAIDIAGVYGQGAGVARLAEVACVVGAAFASREAARRLSRSLPGLGAAVKAGIAYGATLAMGRALVLRFEMPNAWKHRN